MSEIYRNSTQFVYLDIHGGVADATPTAVCTKDGEVTPVTVNGPETLENGAQRWTAVVNLAQTQVAGELKVTWTFSLNGVPASKVDYFDVVVPLVELDDLLVEFADEFDEAELVRTERKVRGFIENYTGQQFAESLETIRVTSETTKFWLPKRLISVTESDPALPNGYELGDNGWTIQTNPPYGYDASGVIVAPASYDIKRDVSTYGIYGPRMTRAVEITGRWGWERVPRPVYEATLLLMEDFLAPESAYRDKFLTSLTSPDWRIQFNSLAFRGTGNIRVDQLLQDYINKHRWVVI